MSKSDDMHAAFTALHDPQLAGPELLPVRLAKACVRVLPVTGAGVSIFTAPTMRIPVGASDDVAAAAERLQFSVAQGPCFDARRTGRLIVATEPVIAKRWPVFHKHDSCSGRVMDHYGIEAVGWAILASRIVAGS